MVRVILYYSFNKVVIARSVATCLHAEVTLRQQAWQFEGLLHFVRNDAMGMSTYLWCSL